MSLTKETSADKIEVVTSERRLQSYRCVLLLRIVEDGAVISQSYHRHVINSGDDWSSEPSNVQAVCSTPCFRRKGKKNGYMDNRKS